MGARDMAASPDILDRVCGEFFEMPGLRLTQGQAQRLWGLDAPTTRQVLDLLLEARFLQQTADGQFRRTTDGQVASPRPRGPRPTLS